MTVEETIGKRNNNNNNNNSNNNSNFNNDINSNFTNKINNQRENNNDMIKINDLELFLKKLWSKEEIQIVINLF